LYTTDVSDGLLLREKLVDETDWILPTSFLALDQGIASTRVCGFLFYDN